MPFLISGEKFRFNYLIRELVKNSIDRSLSLLSSVVIKFYMTEIQTNDLLDLKDHEECYEPIINQSYLVCEVTDFGKYLSSKDIH